MYGSIPTALARVVPESGEPLSIQGYKITPGTIVLTQAWSVHRQERVFRNAQEWLPERWLDETPEMQVRVTSVLPEDEDTRSADEQLTSQEASMPFGLGPRMCLGIKYARHCLVHVRD